MRLYSICLLLLCSACTPAFLTKSDTVRESGLRPGDGAVVQLKLQHPLTVDTTSEVVYQHQLPITPFLSFPAHVGTVNALVVSPDGTQAITGGQDGRVVLFRAIKNSGQLEFERELLLEGNRPILALSLSADGERLAIAQFSSVAIYDLIGRHVVARMTRVLGRILSLAWDPRGESLAFGRANGDIYLWNLKEGWYAGEDHDRALEAYQGATSPVVGLRFHPSGRAFFAAERGGVVVLWRLLRTERELGLRDENAEVDKQKRGRRQVPVARFPGQVETIWLSEYGENLYIAMSDGNVYIWKVRGLRPDVPLTLGPGSVLTVIGGLLPLRASDQLMPTIISAGRGQRVSFWCREPKRQDLTRAPGLLVVPSEAEMIAAAENPELFEGPPIPAEVEKPTTAVLIAQSPLFRDPITHLGTAVTSPLIWAAQQGGAVMVIDSSALAGGDVTQRLKFCPSAEEADQAQLDSVK